MKIVLSKEEKIIYITVSVSILFHLLIFLSTILIKIPVKTVADQPVYVELRDLPAPSEVQTTPDITKKPNILSDRSRKFKEEKRKSDRLFDRKRMASPTKNTQSKKGSKAQQMAKGGSTSSSTDNSGKNIQKGGGAPSKTESETISRYKGNFKEGGTSGKSASDFIPSGKMLAKRFGGGDGSLAFKENKLSAKDELNTQEFLYFSYYKRIHDRLEREWRPVEALERRYGQRFQFAGNQQATIVLMTLNSDGSLSSIQMIKSSDYLELDKEAIRAIEKTQPYEGPPKGIISGDGKIHIKWGFILHRGNKPQLFQIM